MPAPATATSTSLPLRAETRARRASTRRLIAERDTPWAGVAAGFDSTATSTAIGTLFAGELTGDTLGAGETVTGGDFLV